MWCKIKRVENSIFPKSKSKVVWVNYLNKEIKIYVSESVLLYLKIHDIEDFDEVFVVKMFTKEKVVYVIKKVR